MVLQAALEGYGLRHRATVHNIANVDTPGFQRIDVSFEDQLKRAVDRMPSRGSMFRGVDMDHRRDNPLNRVAYKISLDQSSPVRADGSNVSIDREMAILSQNAAKVRDLTELMIRNYSTIKSAIRGRAG